jgi:hypothetical protein
MRIEVTFACDWCGLEIVQKVLDSPPQREQIPNPPFRRLPRPDPVEGSRDWNENLCEECEKEYISAIATAREKRRGVREGERVQKDPVRWGE